MSDEGKMSDAEEIRLWLSMFSSAEGHSRDLPSLVRWLSTVLASVIANAPHGIEAVILPWRQTCWVLPQLH